MFTKVDVEDCELIVHFPCSLFMLFISLKIKTLPRPLSLRNVDPGLRLVDSKYKVDLQAELSGFHVKTIRTFCSQELIIFVFVSST